MESGRNNVHKIFSKNVFQRQNVKSIACGWMCVRTKRKMFTGTCALCCAFYPVRRDSPTPYRHNTYISHVLCTAAVVLIVAQVDSQLDECALQWCLFSLGIILMRVFKRQMCQRNLSEKKFSSFHSLSLILSSFLNPVEWKLHTVVWTADVKIGKWISIDKLF